MTQQPSSIELRHGDAAPRPEPAHGPAGSTTALALAALGVVFGDIGTSPLYALKECVSGPHGVEPSRANVLGVLSLVVWSMTIVVSIKYLGFVTKADNGGEGGIFALLALVPRRERGSGTRIPAIAALVVFGAALLYGDGVITPAISVLSAIEGLQIATPGLQGAVVPLSCAILVGLFAIQRKGTAGIGRLFGPIMVLWFVTLGGLGAFHLIRNPDVLAALSPVHAVRFLSAHSWHGTVVLGAVVLSITGCEALYADMGHFGRRPIATAWYALAMPALFLNYLGQGALVLAKPSAASSPFYGLVPDGPWTYALVGLATCAAVIASQALISGTFSLTRQAVQLGYLPRVTIKHTSSEAEGQIYVPEVNWGLAAACIALVLAFGQSSRLAAAYGIAVTGTMVITSIAYFVVLRRTWKWPLSRALPLVALFLCFDVPFFGATAIKLFDGGYVPIVVGASLFAAMLIWKRGRALLAEQFADAPPLSAFLAKLEASCLYRVPGTAVFLTSMADGAPPILVHHVRCGKALHETVVLLTITTEQVPRVAAAERLRVTRLEKGFYRVLGRYGFMETPAIPQLLRQAASKHGVPVDFDDVTYYLGRETFLATEKGKMGRWSEAIFAFLSRNARPATTYFAIPRERVVELGLQLDL